MKSYEAMFIFRSGLNEEEKKSLIKELQDLLKENQAEIRGSQDFGRRHLAYEIDKCQEGHFYLINFSAQASSVASKLKQACNVHGNVLRILIVKKKLKEAKDG